MYNLIFWLFIRTCWITVALVVTEQLKYGPISLNRSVSMTEERPKQTEQLVIINIFARTNSTDISQFT